MLNMDKSISEAQSKEQRSRAAAKLTDLQALDIIQRSLAGESGRALAVEFGVTHVAISKLVRGLTWQHLNTSRRGCKRPIGMEHPAARVTEEQVRRMRTQHSNGVSYNQLVVAYGISMSAVARIVRRLSWKQVE